MQTPRPIGFWLKLVDRMIDEQFASTLEEHGVTRRQWQLLNILARENATVQQLDTAVAPFLSAPLPFETAPSDTTPSDTTPSDTAPSDTLDAASGDSETSADDPAETSASHLAELVESEWVRIAGSVYELTERGRIALERLSVVVDAQRTLATEGVTPDQYEQTVAVLERVARNLGWND